MLRYTCVGEIVRNKQVENNATICFGTSVRNSRKKRTMDTRSDTFSNEEKKTVRNCNGIDVHAVEDEARGAAIGFNFPFGCFS
mmetsp:Transcript_49782/g.98106  ORF Transcript_49782/g.98106 Transcript_49782/m.98106 type:complete len:83 (-) Transcript_49782:100-348(-)